jgi:hypothetical protein
MPPLVGYSYVSYLQSNIAKVFPYPTKSYVMNKGISGHGPALVHYEFEDTLAHEEWPNIVTIEFSVNLGMDWQQIADIDRLIFFLNTKWEKKGLEHPRYLIIDLFKTQAFYLPPERSDCKKANADELGKMLRFLPGETVNEATKSPLFNHGNPTSLFVRGLANFYGYPLISTKELFWRSFATHFIRFGQCQDSHLPLLPDGIHLSPFSARYFTNVLLIPFFRGLIQCYNSSYLGHNASSTKPVGVMKMADMSFMFPESTYSNIDVVHNFPIWGEVNYRKFNLCDGKTYGIVCILKKEGNWDYLAVGNHSDNMHNVYGLPEQSSPKNSIDILVWAHESKDKASTREVHYLWIDYLVSWNISKYGDMQCSMSKHVFPWNTDVKEIRETPFQEVMGKSLRGQYSLLLPAGTCQGVKVSSTGMCSVQFPKSLDVDVLRTIKCVKLDSREVGFGRFFVIRSG